MATVSQIRASLRNVEDDIVRARKVFDQGKDAIVGADNVMGGLGATYAAIIAAIDAGVAAKPSNAMWLELAARKDALVAEAVAFKTETAAAVAGLG